jgi:NADH:ubiquinone oxidoreductase subunit 4 (subunit M)
MNRGVAIVFWHLWSVITMAVSNRNYELQKNQNYTLNLLVVHSEIENMLCAENLIFFIYNIHSTTHLTAP